MESLLPLSAWFFRGVKKRDLFYIHLGEDNVSSKIEIMHKNFLGGDCMAFQADQGVVTDLCNLYLNLKTFCHVTTLSVF